MAIPRSDDAPGGERSLRVGRVAAPLRSQALVVLRQAILDFHYKPGQRLIERELMADLGVSRTTIREVLRELGSEGLVTSIPQRGLIVASPSLKEAREVYEVRRALEELAMRAFIEKASNEQMSRLRAALTAFENEAGEGGDFRALLRSKDDAYQVVLEGGDNDAVRTEAASIAAAKDADVVIAVAGITSRLEGEEMPVEQPGFAGGDRTTLDMPKPEEDLIQAVAASHKPIVLVLMNGSALGINWEKAHANAIVEAWYSGEEGGAAIARTLAGDSNPAGRLPVTFYESVDQLPAFDDYAMKGRTYRYFTGQPLYAFGYGLSYSVFRYSDIRSNPLPDGQLEIRARVKNDSHVEPLEFRKGRLAIFRHAGMLTRSPAVRWPS